MERELVEVGGKMKMMRNGGRKWWVVNIGWKV